MRYAKFGAVVALLLCFCSNRALCQTEFSADGNGENVNEPSTASGVVSIVRPDDLEAPARHGIEKLCEAIRLRGCQVELVHQLDETNASHVIVTGLCGNPAITSIIAAGGLALPEQPESLAIRQTQTGSRRMVTLCGADAVGLMYAALDTADRLGWAKAAEDIFTHIRDTAESPFMRERSVSTYTMQRAWFEQRLHDPQYWETYFNMLAANRINSYVIIFGYECGGFMAPMYPYFFDVNGFPEIRFNDLTKHQQTRNAQALRTVIQLAHQRGIRVTLGIWDHIYRGKVQAGGIPWAPQTIDPDTPHTVYGVTAENLAAYTKAALRTLITIFPQIDGIQFRMHGESGLTRAEIPTFWRDVFSMLRQLKPTLRFDLRAKGLPDRVIENAIEEDLPFRIATKFWMEQIGMPFHPTHVNPQNQRDRRHGYADLLRFPRNYDMHWRVWSAGSLRMLLWGSPEHVRRFVTESATVYGGKSFEVNEMLATKMLGRPHDESPFALHLPAYRHYEYEFERYWHYYQVWGRIGYDPESPQEIWQQEFARRFGDQSGPLIMRAMHRASGILPRIVAASYNYHNFPTTRGWAGMMRLGDLPRYAEGTGTDIEQFQSYADAARQLLDGDHTALVTPQQTAAHLTDTADTILSDVQAAVAIQEDRDTNAQREFQATVVDMQILVALARYHAARMPAAVWYNIYIQTQDRFALQQASLGEAAAIAAWKQIVEAADGVYSDRLPFGSNGMGFPEHWQEELAALEAGYTQLEKLPSKESLEQATRERLALDLKPRQRLIRTVKLERVAGAAPGEDLTIHAAVENESQLQSVRLRYRHLTQYEDYRTADMVWDAAKRAYVGTIAGEFIDSKWNVMYFIEILDAEGHGAKFPDFQVEQPYVIVPVKR